MRFLVNVLFCFIMQLIIIQSYGQSTVTIDDLSSVTPPAFNIIDVEPKSITRPTTPKGLATTIVSAFDENGLKPNLSLEIAPFWLKKNLGITLDQYLNPTAAQSIRQSFSASLATKERKITQTKNQGTQLGIGFRTQIIPGKASLTTQSLIDETYSLLFLSQIISLTSSIYHSSTLLALKTDIPKAIQDIINDPTIAFTIPGMTSAQARAKLSDGSIANAISRLIDENPVKTGELISDYILRIRSLTAEDKIKELQASMKYRVGWILEVSTASAISFPSNSFKSDVKYDKLGVWGNLSYRFENQKDEFNFLVRHTNSFKDSVFTNTDLGLSLAHNAKDYNISLEGIFRLYKVEFDGKNFANQDIRIVDKNSTYRIALNGNYKLSDVAVLTATFGKNYDNSLFSSGNLLALLGINFGLKSTQNLNVK